MFYARVREKYKCFESVDGLEKVLSGVQEVIISFRQPDGALNHVIRKMEEMNEWMEV